ncbi:MAG: hypothetical protein JOS17DRAFT_274497 [Linnemannia elongata]|nr:MAG: hypothetical protein JOS17DRAFT_274497 [Linnemannia elongata]
MPWACSHAIVAKHRGFQISSESLSFQVVNKLVQDRLGNGLWGSEDRGPLCQHVYGSDAAEEIRHALKDEKEMAQGQRRKQTQNKGSIRGREKGNKKGPCLYSLSSIGEEKGVNDGDERNWQDETQTFYTQPKKVFHSQSFLFKALLVENVATSNPSHLSLWEVTSRRK